MCASLFKTTTSLIVIALAALTQTANAQTPVTRYPTADSYVHSAGPNNNYGTSQSLGVQTATSFHIVSFLTFDTTGVPNDLSRAVLRVRARLNSTAVPSLVLTAYGVSNPTWGETALTWNSGRPPTAPQLSSVTIVGTAQVWYELDVTSFVRSQKGSGLHVLGFALTNATVSTVPIVINSRETAFDPELVMTPNQAPNVTLVSPPGGTCCFCYATPANITFEATASDPDANDSISRVEAWANGAKLGNMTHAGGGTYTYSWNNPPNGSHQIKAVAFDTFSGSTHSLQAGVIVRANTAPSISIVSPLNGLRLGVQANTLEVLADAADPDTEPALAVSLFEDGNFVGTMQPTAISGRFSYVWENVPQGVHVLTAQVADSCGGQTTSQPVTIHVRPNPLQVSIVKPASGTIWLPPAEVVVEATASDPDLGGWIERVEFYEGTALRYTAESKPYRFTWDNNLIGERTIVARAIDGRGAHANSAPVTFTIPATPGVSMLSPIDGTVLYTPVSSIQIQAAATAPPGGSIDRLELWVLNYKLGDMSPAGGGNYTYTWNNPYCGVNGLYVRAYGDNGHYRTSATNTVMVSGPAVYIDEPLEGAILPNGAVVTVKIRPTAPVPPGTWVHLIDNGTMVWVTVPMHPDGYWEAPWYAAEGNHTLIARAYYPAGCPGLSSYRNVTINRRPVMTIVDPDDNENFAFPGDVTIRANVTDDSPIAQVNFYIYPGGVHLTDTTPPFEVSWTPPYAGEFTVYGYARDSAGVDGWAPAGVTFTTGNRGPKVTVTSPAPNPSFLPGAVVTINASAADPDDGDTVTQMKLYELYYDWNTETLVTQVSGNTLQHQWTVPNDKPGMHRFRIEAIDNRGGAGNAQMQFAVLSDRDYDGRTDQQESAEGTNPTDPESAAKVRLGYWSFDVNANGDSGQVPWYNNASIVPGLKNGALELTSDANGWANAVMYRETEANGSANVNCQRGTIRFWFKPAWTSQQIGGTGPGANPRFFELGGYSGDATFGQWSLYLTPDGNLLGFGGHVDGRAYEYFTYPLSWRQGRWYQVVVTYDTTHSALYINGEFAAGGPGMNEVLPAAVRAYSGFRVGFDLSGGQSPKGIMDELETFNYPFTAQQIAYDLMNAASPPVADTDDDGRNDFLEQHVDATDLNNPVAVKALRLGHWRFNTPDWLGEQGQVPLDSTLAFSAPSWSGTALSAWDFNYGIIYRETEANGQRNVNTRKGTVRFWFKPNWTSGQWQAEGHFVDVGGQWVIGFTGDGATLAFWERKSTGVPNVQVPINWEPGRWRQVTLVYSDQSSQFYIDGVPAGTPGAGVTQVPTPAERALGMSFGIAVDTSAFVGGDIDEVETFNYQLTAAEILRSYNDVRTLDPNHNGIPAYMEDELLAPGVYSFNSEPFVVAGAIEAEQYNRGGGYWSVLDNANTTYRPSKLVIEPVTDDIGKGYCVTKLRQWDYLLYDFKVQRSGLYTISVRVSPVTPSAQGGSVETRVYPGCEYNCYLPSKTIQLGGWQNLTWENVQLEAGVHTLQVYFNGVSPTDCDEWGCFAGRINYISIYPTVPAFDASVVQVPEEQIVSVMDFGAQPNDMSATAAAWNRQAFNDAVDWVAAWGGGIVNVPAGTYLMASANPSELPGQYPDSGFNFVVRVPGNVKIVGAGKDNTILLAMNRSTTMFHIFSTTPNPLQNVALENMTIQGRPHIRIDGQYDPGAFFNFTPGSEFAGGQATLVVVSAWYPFGVQNFSIRNCRIKNPSCYGVVIGNLDGGLFENNEFLFWDGEALPGPTTGSASNPTPVGQVGIFGNGAPSRNIVVRNCLFNGNPALLPQNNNDYSSDGIVWFQAGGNFFVEGNTVLNYGLEAVQYNAGPGAVVGNQFITTQRNGSAGALVAVASGWPSLTGQSSDQLFTMVGNYVRGGREGYFGAYFASKLEDPLYDIYVAGNEFDLDPPVIGGYWADWPSSAILVANCRVANVAGNTLTRGEMAFRSLLHHTTGQFLQNDFSLADQIGIWYEPGPDALNPVVLAFNKLGSGRPMPARSNVQNYPSQAHFRSSFDDSRGVFFIQNQFRDGAATVAPRLTPRHGGAHFK